MSTSMIEGGKRGGRLDARGTGGKGLEFSGQTDPGILKLLKTTGVCHATSHHSSGPHLHAPVSQGQAKQREREIEREKVICRKG